MTITIRSGDNKSIQNCGSDAAHDITRVKHGYLLRTRLCFISHSICETHKSLIF